MATVDEETARAVERARETFPDAVAPRRVVFGFDGYLDRVREVVADRRDPQTYERMATLAALSDRVGHSVDGGSSLTLEWLQTGTRTGGLSAHLSRVYEQWGFSPVMIGTYGDPEREPFATEFADCERHTLGEPGVTDAVEFDDGKLMLTEMGATMDLDWARIEERVGRETLRDRLDGAAILGVGYWSDAPAMPNVLDGLRDLWSEVADPPSLVFLDPADVRKLDRDRIRAGRDAIAAFADVATVVVTANRAETGRLAEAFGDESGTQQADARAAHDALGPDLFVSHGVDRSVAVDGTTTARVAVPRVDDPTLTTSSGDHFNAGFALAHIEGLDPGPALAVGNTVAREFVRTGTAPSLDDVRTFLGAYERAL